MAIIMSTIQTEFIAFIMLTIPVLRSGHTYLIKAERTGTSGPKVFEFLV